MKIGIVAAMDLEISEFIQEIMEPLHPLTGLEGDIYGKMVYETQLGDHSVVMCSTGIGKVNSSLIVSKLIELYNLDLIINVGTICSMNPHIKVGDIIVGDCVAYHDLWCGHGTRYGQADGCRLYFHAYGIGIGRLANMKDTTMTFGLICSGDRFINHKDQMDSIKTYFPNAIACDMESASIAHTCYKHQVPFMVIREVSDNITYMEDTMDQYNTYLKDKTRPKLYAVVKRLIETLFDTNG